MRTAANRKKWKTLNGERNFDYLVQSSRETLCFILLSGDHREGIQRLVVSFISIDGKKKSNSLIRHLTGFETTAIAAFRLVIPMKSNLSDSHCIIVMVGAIQGCYGDCSSWQRRDVICMIAHPYSSCIEHTCCYSTQVSI